MKNADLAKHRAGQSTRESTESLPWGYTASAMGKENRGWGMWFAVLQIKETKDAFAMKGRDWKAGKEWKWTIKNFKECYEARYSQLVQRQCNFNSYSKMLKYLYGIIFIKILITNGFKIGQLLCDKEWLSLIGSMRPRTTSRQLKLLEFQVLLGLGTGYKTTVNAVFRWACY